MHYIYILYSESSNIYYVGESTNPWKRLIQHNAGLPGKFTSRYSNWVIRAVFLVENRTEALKLERFIKKQKSRKLIERLCDPTFVPNGKLSPMKRVSVADC